MTEQTPRPTAPHPPSPADLAARRRPAAVAPVVPVAPAASTDPSVSAAFGRVAEDGTVYVRTEDGERAVGSYPGAGPEEALAYFARKYDELYAAALLLARRVAQTDLPAQEARASLKSLRAQIGDANVVGDLAALGEKVARIEEAVTAKAKAESQQRAEAKAAAAAQREALVAEAESITERDPQSTQWKQASTRMREILGEWQVLQRRGPRLDKDVESSLWQRLSSARTAFDKQRKQFFSQLDDEHAEARRAKEKLVAEAERLATSKEWGPTAGAFKQLMQQWKSAGRAQRSVDDTLWERFKAAQDAFFEAKDQVTEAENAQFRANLQVKEQLLTEAEALVPVRDLEAAKSALRSIQDRWDAAGKVPREDVSRVEGRLRKVEQAVRDLDEARWKRSNPELGARAQSMVEQLERAVQGLEQNLAAAEAGGDEREIAAARDALAARRQWLDSARGGLREFGG